jgi:hypothetical protein
LISKIFRGGNNLKNKDDKLIKALIKGTEDKKIKWYSIKNIYLKELKEIGETVEAAYYFEDVSLGRRIILYKSSSIGTDPYSGEEIEKVNIHLAFSDIINYKPTFKISDYELNNSSLIWTLYKLVQRSESGADSVIDALLKEFENDEDLPF